MKKLTLSLVAASILSAAPGSASAPAPRIAVKTVDQLAPLPLPYNEAANGTRDVVQTRARAKKNGKLLLIDLGGNWCLDCRILAGVMERPEMRTFLRRHYEVVTVDVGRFDKNMAIPQHYGIKKLAGVPAVLIVDPRTDRLINAGRVTALADARTLSPQALADWLARWTR
ncbi:thioredoxin family protein [Sphingomonas piscis]|uniref:Thioredoxin family protein n=1 Tax=Sphingomonas piscis TaxID=2714943 RepID=A0A6G7YLR5_9SPHN|nr:thioredoxin family protein [Sphingomonas piscis]QIK77684.1 thioredoxin family protein [Sphingomonas piscis]